MDEDKELIELAKTMSDALCCEGGTFQKCARIARDHFAAKTPAMNEERRREAIEAFKTWCLRMKVGGDAEVVEVFAEANLVQWGLIPPAKVPSVGERFAATCHSLDYDQIGKRVDEAFGPLIELGKRCEVSADTTNNIMSQASKALAHLDATLGGK